IWYYEHIITQKLQPTSVEMKINFIRVIAQESYVRTAPGTIEQLIEVGSERVTRIVGVQREEEELILQDQSMIFVLSDVSLHESSNDDDEDKLNEESDTPSSLAVSVEDINITETAQNG
nr:protein phosphatase inhibitor 2 [Tanacetum cinerariifolium]